MTISSNSRSRFEACITRSCKDIFLNLMLPSLQNTDGDLIEPTTMTYAILVSRAAEAFERLRPLATLDGESTRRWRGLRRHGGLAGVRPGQSGETAGTRIGTTPRSGGPCDWNASGWSSKSTRRGDGTGLRKRSRSGSATTATLVDTNVTDVDQGARGAPSTGRRIRWNRKLRAVRTREELPSSRHSRQS